MESHLGIWTLRKPSGSEYRFLNDFYRYFFAEIIDPSRRGMLEKCFVSDSRLTQAESDLKRVLADVAPNYLGDSESVPPGALDEILSVGNGDNKGTVVLVTGSVGAGKSTFVTKIRIEKREDPNTHFVVIDLIDERAFSTGAPDSLVI